MENKYLIIFAHPSKESHAGYTLSKCIEFLKEKNLGYDVVDLYDLKFNPVLKDVNSALKSEKIDPEIHKFQKLIFDSKNLIFIYPTWWQNVPAILKGFIDKVFTRDFGFKYMGGRPIGLLKGRNAVVLTTTGGPTWFTKLIKRSRSIKIMTKDVLSFCGIKSKGYYVGNARELNEIQKQKIVKNVNRAMDFLIK